MLLSCLWIIKNRLTSDTVLDFGAYGHKVLNNLQSYPGNKTRLTAFFFWYLTCTLNTGIISSLRDSVHMI